MAFYVRIEKCTECDVCAKYRFWGIENDSGEFEIDKRSGQVRLLIAAEGDKQEHFFNRAAVKIMREWKKGNLPETAVWAS